MTILESCQKKGKFVFTVLVNSYKIKLVLVDAFKMSMDNKIKLAKTMLKTSVELTYGLAYIKFVSLNTIDT